MYTVYGTLVKQGTDNSSERRINIDILAWSKLPISKEPLGTLAWDFEIKWFGEMKPSGLLINPEKMFEFSSEFVNLFELKSIFVFGKCANFLFV